MDSFVQNRGRAALTAFAVAWLAFGGLALAGQADKAAGKAPVKASGQASAVQTPHGAYAGTATCLSCHEDRGAATKQGPHSRAFRAGGPMSPTGCQTCHGDTKAALGCEGCHGPGKDHADAGGDKTKIRRFEKLSATQASSVCSSCHFRTKHTMWAGSQHDQRNVGCTTCHSVHAAKGDKQLKAASETDLCASCHRAIVNKQLKFNHMPVREGKLSCSSCHNVHGAANVKLLRTGGTIFDSCVSCHAEKRGPTLWEHAPVTENCVTCHDPHGSNNERMLVAKEPFLCQRCHVTSRHPPTVYEGYLLNNSTNGNKIYGRQCAACHQQVHGSNAPSGKALLR
jgi:DmsE family decaheme c-type cytochrome